MSTKIIRLLHLFLAGIDSIQVGHVRIMQGHVYRSMLDYVSASLDNSLQGQVYPLRKAISNTGMLYL